MINHKDNEMKKHNVAFQKQFGFRFAVTQKSNKVERRGLCSTITDDIDNKNDVFNVNAVNFKELSCTFANMLTLGDCRELC